MQWFHQKINLRTCRSARASTTFNISADYSTGAVAAGLTHRVLRLAWIFGKVLLSKSGHGPHNASGSLSVSTYSGQAVFRPCDRLGRAPKIRLRRDWEERVETLTQGRGDSSGGHSPIQVNVSADSVHQGGLYPPCNDALQPSGRAEGLRPSALTLSPMTRGPGVDPVP